MPQRQCQQIRLPLISAPTKVNLNRKWRGKKAVNEIEEGRDSRWMNGRRKLAPTGVKCVCSAGVNVPSSSTDGQDTPQITDIAEEEFYYVRQRYFFFNVGDHIVSSFLRCRSSGNDMPPPGGRPAMRSCSQRLEWCADCGMQHTKGEYSSRQ
jgi:hypothetical protein